MLSGRLHPSTSSIGRRQPQRSSPSTGRIRDEARRHDASPDDDLEHHHRHCRRRRLSTVCIPRSASALPTSAPSACLMPCRKPCCRIDRRQAHVVEAAQAPCRRVPAAVLPVGGDGPVQGRGPPGAAPRWGPWRRATPTYTPEQRRKMLESVAHPAVKPPLSIATFAIPRLAGELLPRPPRIRPEESASTDLSDAARPEAYVSESESEPDHDDEGDARQPAADEVDDARAPATTATEESPVGTRRRPRQQDDPGSGADDSVVSRKQQTRQQTTKDVQQAFKYLKRSGPMGLKIVARSRRPPTLHLSGLYAGMAYPRPAVRSVLPLPVGPGVDLLHDVVPFRLPFAMAHERLAELELDQARRSAPPSTLAPPPFILIRKSVGLRGQTFIDDDVYVCDCVDVCDEYCQNRMTWHECNPDECRAVQCNNQALQRQECAQISLQHMGDKGWGIRLDQDVRQGDLIVEYVGELVDKVESTRRLNVDYAGESNFYILAISSDLYIDATRQGNLSRFTNHSCEPTCETQLWMVRGQPRLGIFALRDLPAGAEVTFDYKFSRYSDVDVQCLCGSGNCRGFLGATAPPKRPRTNGKKPEPGGPLTDKDILEMARNDVTASKFLSTVREANQGADQRVVLLRSLARGRGAFLRRLTRPPSSVDGC